MKDWRDWPETTTPITAAELERMEGATEQAANAAGAATSAVAGFAGRIGAAEGRIGSNEAGVSALQSGKADKSHTHAIADTTGLQTALDGKAAKSHSHPGADITGGVVKTVNGAPPDAAGDLTVNILTNGTAEGQILRWDNTAKAWKAWAPTWITIPLPSGVTVPAGHLPLAYMIDFTGCVRLRGAVVASASAKITWPSAIMPKQTLSFLVITSINNASTMVINTYDNSVAVSAATHFFYSSSYFLP